MDKNVSVGYCDFRSSGPLLASVWKDKRIIHFLSTIHVAQASSPVTVQRREKDGTRSNVECLPLLPDYQSFMRGIDRGDQLMGYYNVGRRSFMRGIDRGDQLMGYYNVGRRSFMRGIDRGDQLMGYYNVGRRSFMRGIDRGDQLLGYYNVGRRSFMRGIDRGDQLMG